MGVRLGRRWWVGGLGALFLGGVVALAASQVCLTTWLWWGVGLRQCPEGRLRQTVALIARGVSRGGAGSVWVWADAHGVDARGHVLNSRVRRGSAELFLVDAAGKETPLPPAPRASWTRGSRFDLMTEVALPEVPDGDYRLRARLTTPLGQDTVEAPLALYAPARVQVLTDRPLYEPGHSVRFRAVALRARDLVPLENRPGTWTLKDPTGEVVLEERAPSGPWGVVSGEFPLDRGASAGRWTVTWASGDASGEAHFQVEPFTLPRFQVEALSPRPFWRAGEQPEVEGKVAYGSGAPVAGAEVALTWRFGGEWPPPTEWRNDGLPKKARTDAAGHFQVTLPRVPLDLRGKATLSASVVATDPAGDTARSEVSLLLSEDALAVSAMTELESGLVEGFSNRVYLRATTADGQVLPGAELTVTRAWDARDEGVHAVADADGVAAFQFDPGPAVNVVVPPMPVRHTPRPPPVQLSASRDLLSEDESVSLEDQLALEKSLPALAPCARFVSEEDGSAEASLGLRVNASGAVVDLVEADGAGAPLVACLGSALRARALGAASRERLLSLTFSVSDPGLPSLTTETRTTRDDAGGLEAALRTAALDARACLPPGLENEAPVPVAMTWRTRKGRPDVAVSWAPRSGLEDALSASTVPCIQARFARLQVAPPSEGEEDSREDALGVTWLTAHPANGPGGEGAPQATTMLGYQLKVEARVAGKSVGDTKLVLRPAQLPDARLRASPVLPSAGGEVTVELLRGPGFRGALPEKLILQAGEARLESKVDRTTRSARFRLPTDFEGWASAQWSGATARVYVAPRARMSVEVSPDRTAYAPGALAHLQVRTRVEGRDGPAAVGLVGVDSSLAQLAPLPGPDAMDSLRLAPTLSAPAFGVLDGQALAMGRIRGENAAAAVLMRVQHAPSREELERSVNTRAMATFDPEVELTEPFFAVLAELRSRARAWEAAAPEGTILAPSDVARLWEQALGACEQRGERVTDAYGRKLRLSRLPAELLSLTDPRVMVSGTRLSEDVENWGEWVAREAP
ncbi:hypothetical protein KRR26_24970 [Corallococcus sp. M34]|uniref:MG2 domain-containing protein n=1 Tax=Citreicoccus inhibens TaxID=2849499 RepID=UPI001C231F76|nr:MG2 domain-containing protein [Citreicoccus inhibens]MBU8898868.1 hypothetical protein [Citreicoccus inhibens]